MSHESGLRVRQHRRQEIELPVEFIIAAPHRPQVRYSASSSAVNEYTVRGTSVDISPGGMGFICRQFVPRMCEGTIRVFDPTPVGSRPDGTPIHEVAFAQRVKVRRVRMTSTKPTYFIGVAFADPENVDPDISNRMALLKQQSEGAGAAAGSPFEDAGGPDA